MAKYYSRREMGMCDERIRENEHVYVSQVRDEVIVNADVGVRGNADEFRALSHRDDHVSSIKDSSTCARFQWDSSFNGLRGGPSSTMSGQFYDNLVERPLTVVSRESTRNVPTYDLNAGGFEYRGRARESTGLLIEDARNYSVREKEREHLQRTEREFVRQAYDEENGLMFRPEDGSHSLTPLSQSSGQRTPSRGIPSANLLLEGQYRSVDGIGSSFRMPSSRPSSYYRTQHPNASGISHSLSPGGVSPRGRGDYAPNVHRSDGYVCLESRLSRDFYLKPASGYKYDDDQIVQDYQDRGSSVSDVANVSLPRDHYVGNSRRGAAMEDVYSRLNSPSRPLQEIQHISDNSDESRIVHEMVYGEVNIGAWDSHPDHRTEEICVYSDGPRLNDGILLMDENTSCTIANRDLTSPEHANTTLKRRHGFVNEMNDVKRRAYASRGISSYDMRHHSVEDEEDFGLSDRITRHHDISHSMAHIGVSRVEARQPSNGLPMPLQRPVHELDEPSRGDVKTRLKFPQSVSHPCATQVPWTKESKRLKAYTHVKNTTSSVKTCGKAKATNFKKKLKLVPKPVACSSTSPDCAVSQSEPNIYNQQKHANKDPGSMNDSLRSSEVDPDQTLLKVKPLPENPEKFEETVDEWFLKCMVDLNGNISRQKKFKGQVSGGRFKCDICSSFKEFRETKDVAAHAFSSLKVGYRAQHLGLHRALCVIMGWNNAAAANGRWVCQSLPEPVAWTLKEDVIIWPPVVIVHNYPARNYQLNEIGKVFIKLEDVLKADGFSREIKACHKNPGNPNIMIVVFSGTLPGLKEAERLHYSFAENKCGRAKLGQLDSEVVHCKSVGKKPEDMLKLVDKGEDDQEPVDKNEVEQEPVDKDEVEQEPVGKDEVEQEPVDNTKDEQSEHKTNDYQKQIDRSEDEDEPLDKVKLDQQPAGKAEDEQEPVDKIRGGQESAVEEAQGEQKPIGRAEGDQEQVNERRDTQGLSDNNRKDDQESLHKTEYDRDGEPVGQAKDIQDLVGKKDHTLYGYLGIIEDLHRLPNDVKRRYRARSKTEIFASYNASF